MHSFKAIPRIASSLALIATAMLGGRGADAAIYSANGLELYGDFRFRLEADWDSQTAAGVEREDRTRARIRARVGLTYKPTDYLSVGLRLRSGSDDSHQSPHVTILDFDNNPTGDADFNLDRWYLRADGKKLWAWAGRNSLPFWRADELRLDDDIAAAGLAAGYSTEVGDNGKLSLNTGYFTLPVGMRDFVGNLGAGQIVYETERPRGGFTAAAALFSFDADPDDPNAGRLLTGNGFRDYTIWEANLQGRFQAGSLPVLVGVDLLHNSEDYSPTDPDPFTAANFDQTDGWVGTVRFGSTAEKGDWLFAYFYARIEAFAVNASYAQDDWLRWGSATQTRSSNFKGHELRFGYALERGWNLIARLYLVESITTIEDGNRFRLDMNFRF